jgi:deoxycytidylate deaminase
LVWSGTVEYSGDILMVNKFFNHPAFKLAIEEAKKSEHKHKIGAVIFKGKRIVSSAHNAVRCNKIPRQFKSWIQSLHAECGAIIKAKKDLKGYSIIVIRLNNKNELMMSKPCSLCESFIEYVGVKEVYWSTNQGGIECQ